MSLICGITGAALAQQTVKVERLGKGIDDIVPAGATIKKMAGGYTWRVRDIKVRGVRQRAIVPSGPRTFR
jgi:hypothetical protein